MTAILLPQHLADLRRSGLTDDTVNRYGISSLTDPAEIQHRLGWKHPAKQLGPCLEFRCRHINGDFNGFVALKPDKPRVDNGKPIKYEHPLGVERQPSFGEEASLILLDGWKDCLVIITEGFKKQLRIEQAGIGAIGLSGVNAWSRPKEKPADDRVLNKWLAEVDWEEQLVAILFDTDTRRNPDVNRESAYLAVALSAAGARVHVINLPMGPRDSQGIPGKMGADDYIVAFGEDSFRQIVQAQIEKDHRPIASLEDFRRQLRDARIESLQQPGNVFFDGSPTGSGKSHADLAAMKLVQKSLVVLPTHKNCREFETTCETSGLNAVAYPAITVETCANYDEAERALESGLSVSQAVCFRCPHKLDCDYQYVLQMAENAPHRIATHHRGSLCLSHLAEGRGFIALHEDCTDILRPGLEISGGLQAVAKVADETITLAVKRQDFVLNPDRSEEYFFRRMHDIATELIEHLQSTPKTRILELPFATGATVGVDARLFEAMGNLGVWPSGEAVQLVKCLAAGEIRELVLRVDEIFAKGGKRTVRRSVIGIRENTLPKHAVCWVSDATAERGDVEAMLSRPVADKTPPARLKQFHPVVQVTADVTKRTSRANVVALLRGLLLRLEYVRIGIITHREHVPAIEGTGKVGPVLDQDLRQRIAKVEHFRGGQSRGSNEWLGACDCLIVLGTPRVPPEAIKRRLIQFGLPAAAVRNDKWIEWGKDYWLGTKTDGQRVAVKTLAYRCHDWHRAHQSIVRAELIQACGRGRSITESGIPVIVCTTEDLSLPILDYSVEKIDETEALALSAVNQLTVTFATGSEPQVNGHFRYKNIVAEVTVNAKGGTQAIETAEVANNIGKSEEQTRRILRRLESVGLLKRMSERGGWILSTVPKINLYAAAGIEQQITEETNFVW